MKKFALPVVASAWAGRRYGGRVILADDLFLLLLDRDGKQAIPTDSLNVGLAGALLVDLAESRRIDVAPGAGSLRRSPRVTTPNGPPPGDEVLDGALDLVRRHQGKKVTTVITRMAPDLRATVAGRLVRAGIVDDAGEKVLAVFPTHRWRIRNPGSTQALRQRLREVLSADVRTEERVRALIALLQAVDGLKRALTADGAELADWSAAKKRAKAMAHAQWSAQAVRSVIQASQAAVAAAGTAAITAATASWT